MTSVFYWVGAFACAVLALGAIWAVGELLWAAVVAGSVVRFVRRALALHGDTLPLALAMHLFFDHWVESIGFRKGSTTIALSNGRWRGVGDWYAHPPSVIAPVEL